MARVLGTYFLEIFWQGVVLGLLVGLIFWFPALWVKVILGVALLFVLWRLTKNPRHFWKRVAWAGLALLPLTAGMDLSGKGELSLGTWLQLALSGSISPLSPWVAVAIVGLAAAADTLSELPSIVRRSWGGILWADASAIRVPLEIIGACPSFCANCSFVVGLNGGKVALSLTNVRFRLKTILPFLWIEPDKISVDSRRKEDDYWSRGTAYVPLLNANERFELLVTVCIEKRWKRRLLFWWSFPRTFFPRVGEILLEFGDEPRRQVSANADLQVTKGSATRPLQDSGSAPT